MLSKVIVYFISGLGADKRAFENLSLPENWEIIHLDWLDIDNGESLTSYVDKFSNLINKSQEFSLVGLSFGGIIATELSKKLHPQKTIIISSISTKFQLPFLFKLIGRLQINKVIPQHLFNRVYPFTDWYFGTKTKHEKILIRKIIRNTSPKFLKWAINEIFHWKNQQKEPSVYHIHGTTDKIFPIRKIKADLLIKDAGHFMVYNKADTISEILIKQLS